MSYAESCNLAKPGREDILKPAPHIAEKTYLFTDVLNSYSALADKLKSDRKILIGKEDYDSLNHRGVDLLERNPVGMDGEPLLV